MPRLFDDPDTFPSPGSTMPEAELVAAYGLTRETFLERLRETPLPSGDLPGSIESALLGIDDDVLEYGEVPS